MMIETDGEGEESLRQYMSKFIILTKITAIRLCDIWYEWWMESTRIIISISSKEYNDLCNDALKRDDMCCVCIEPIENVWNC